MGRINNTIKSEFDLKKLISFILIFAIFRFLVMFKEFLYIAKDFSYGDVLYLAGIFLYGPLSEVSLCIAMFPIISTSYDEFRTGHYLYTVPRLGLKSYGWSKIILTFVYVFLISFLANTLLAGLLSIPMDFAPKTYINDLLGFEKIKLASPYAFFILKNLFISLSFVSWSILGQALVFYLKSKYVAMLSAVFLYTLFNLGPMYLNLFSINNLLWAELWGLSVQFNIAIALISNIALLIISVFFYKRSLKKVVIT